MTSNNAKCTGWDIQGQVSYEQTAQEPRSWSWNEISPANDGILLEAAAPSIDADKNTSRPPVGYRDSGWMVDPLKKAVDANVAFNARQK